MRIGLLFISLVLISSMIAGCIGDGDTSYSESGVITEGWIDHPENNGTKDHFGIPVLHTFTVSDGEKVSVESAVVSINYSETDEDNVPRIESDSMVFTIKCDDGSEYVSEMASPLPSGSGECEYTVTKDERWFPENEYEVHSVSIVMSIVIFSIVTHALSVIYRSHSVAPVTTEYVPFSAPIVELGITFVPDQVLTSAPSPSCAIVSLIV